MSAVNIEELREALDAAPPSSYRDWSDEEAHHFDVIDAAVRAVLDAPQVWWCKEHEVGARGMGRRCGAAVYVMEAGLVAKHCHLVKKALVPVKKGEK